MKELYKILRIIHSWPEEARRLVVFAAIIVAGIIIFSLWTGSVSSRLNRFGTPTEVTQKSSLLLEKNSDEAPALPGIIESLRAGVNDGFAIIGEGAEKIWKYIYEPLRK